MRTIRQIEDQGSSRSCILAPRTDDHIAIVFCREFQSGADVPDVLIVEGGMNIMRENVPYFPNFRAFTILLLRQNAESERSESSRR
jgi:hypothetical protein